MWLIQGGIGVSFIDIEGIVSPAYRIYNLKNEFQPKFCDYLMRSHFYVEEYNCYIRGLTTYDRSVRKEDFNDILVILPTPNEQNVIVSYLDRRCGKIDSLIAKKRLLIDKYREKINVIVQTSSEKSNPASKFWLNISDSWEVEKAKWIFTEFSSRNHPEEELLAATQDRGVIPKSMCSQDFVSPSGDYDGLKLVTGNDFVISLRSFQGGIEHSAYRGIISPAYTVIRLKPQYNNQYYIRYFKYLFKTPQLISLLNTAISGIRDGKNINWADFCDLPLPIPSIEDIEKMQGDFDRYEHLVRVFEKEERILEEYKTTLISEVVTGKIKVA
jgi:type I restriction enzyme S subunit